MHLRFYIFLPKESVSLTTGFVTFCCFNLTMMVITLSVKLLEIRSSPELTVAWLVAMAITPTIWIYRNKNMKEKAKQLLTCNYYCRKKSFSMTQSSDSVVSCDPEP